MSMSTPPSTPADGQNRITSRFQITKPSRGSVRAVILAVLMVTSMFAMAYSPGGGIGIAAGDDHETNETNEQFFDDFEEYDVDEEPDGWDVVETGDGQGGDLPVVDDSYYGDRGLQLNDDDVSDVIWSDGPEFNTQDNFEFSGTYKAEGDDNRIRFGLADENREDKAVLVVSMQYDSIFLANNPASEEPDEDNSIDDAHLGEWMDFRMQFDDGEVRVKVWESGEPEPSEWQIEDEFDAFTGQFYTRPGGSSTESRTITYDRIDGGGNQISGQVVDQDGNPVSNATVEAVGVDFNNLDERLEDEAANLEAEADTLLDEAQDPLPDSWDSDLNVIEHTEESDERNYVLAHNQRDWSHSGSTTIFSEEIDDPRIQLDPDDQHVLSVWDPEDENLVMPQNPMDNSFHGAIDGDDSVVIEQLAPSGEKVDSWTTEPDTTYVAERQWPASDIERDVVRTNLPEGHFYRVYPESNEAASYVVVVGDHEDIREQFVHDMESQADDLEDEAGELTEHAQNIQDKINDGTFSRTTTTTDEDGYYTVNVPMNVERASVQAYRADGELLTDIEGASISDLKDAHDMGYSGSMYLSQTPERVSPPDENVEIETHKVDTPPWANPEEWSEIVDELKDEFEQFNHEELKSIFQGELDELEREELEELAEELNELGEQNEHLEDIIDDIEGSTDEELIENIEELERELQSLEDVIEELESGSEVGEDYADAFARFSGELEEENVQVIGHWTDGSSFTVPDEYVKVEHNPAVSGQGSTEVSVADYPIDEDDLAGLNFEFRVVGEDGVGSGSEQVTNPSFDGVIPELDSIQLTSSQPSPQESTSIRVNSDDPEFDEVTDVEVVGPDGQDVDVSERSDGDGHTFTPADEGIHRVQVTFTDATGEEFVETFRMNAGEQSFSGSPTLRAVDGATGTYAVVSDGLVDGEIQKEDGETQITAVTETSEISDLHVALNELDRDERKAIDVNIQRADDRQNINRHVQLIIHSQISSDGLVYAQGNPITDGPDTRFGEVRLGEDKDMIYTYTDDRASATIHVSDEPGFVETQFFNLRVWSPFDLPGVSVFGPMSATTGTAAMSSGVGAVGLGIGLIVRFRNRGDSK